MLYFENGYVNIPWILERGLPFNFIVGGRGTGKTFTSLQTMITQHKKFFFMRRMQSQADVINNDDMSPMKPVNEFMHTNYSTIKLQHTKNISAFAEVERNEKGKVVNYKPPIGYIGALSTLSSVRGFNPKEVEVIIYDEFIPEVHERPIKEEGVAFLNAYETINRNRELDNGEPPVQVLALANSNNLANPIFMEFELIEKAMQMYKSRQEVFIDRERGVGIYLLLHSDISERKMNTALYKAVANSSEFINMAINNEFSTDTHSVRTQNIKEYRPIVTIGEITVYSHKSKNQLYVTTHRSGNVPKYGVSGTDVARFKTNYIYIIRDYYADNIYFETTTAEVIFKKYFNL